MNLPGKLAKTEAESQSFTAAFDFQNAEYLAKKDAEEAAWSKFQNPYATTSPTIV